MARARTAKRLGRKVAHSTRSMAAPWSVPASPMQWASSSTRTVDAAASRRSSSRPKSVGRLKRSIVVSLTAALSNPGNSLAGRSGSAVAASNSGAPISQ